MAILGEEVENGYLARVPGKARLPGVLVLQEAWGVDAHIEDVARRFAAAGYLAFAPDLFAQNGARPPELSRERLKEAQQFLNSLPLQVTADPQQRDAAVKAAPNAARLDETLHAAFGAAAKLDQFVPAIVAAAAWLRGQSSGQVCAVGYCMGGGLSALLAAHDPRLSGAVIYYGSSPAAELVPRIACPVLGFYGANDPRITSTVAPFAAQMQAQGKRFEPHIYEGAGHAFHNDNRPTYDARAARDSIARTLSFLHSQTIS